MVTVKMPRAQWDTVLMLINEESKRGYLVDALYKEIEDQVYSQEY